MTDSLRRGTPSPTPVPQSCPDSLGSLNGVFAGINMDSPLVSDRPSCNLNLDSEELDIAPQTSRQRLTFTNTQQTNREYPTQQNKLKRNAESHENTNEEIQETKDTTGLRKKRVKPSDRPPAQSLSF